MKIEEFQLHMDEYLPLRDVVFQTLRKAILRGELRPGERLMEIHLAQKLGVSRTPVREAIRKLEQEGLAVMIPRRGAVVAEITASELQDVLEVRMALEELAVKKACKGVDENSLERLKQASGELSKALQKGTDPLECAEKDMKFHDVIYDLTGNRRLVQMINSLREQMYRFRIEYLKDPDTYPALLTEHEKIVAALENRNEEMALQVMKRHIGHQREYILNRLEKKA